MPALPNASDFNASTVTEGDYKAAQAALLSCIAGLLGSDGTAATALATLGAMICGHVAKTAAYTVTTADRGLLIAASGTWTLGLVAAATAGPGFALALRNTGTGLITIDPAGAETINGAATLRLAPGHAVLVISTGAAWLTIGRSGDEVTSLPDGTAAAPALTFTGDPDTGVIRPAANQLALVTGAVQRLLLTAAALQIDVPLTGTAVQASSHDATPGRLARLFGTGGLFGFGVAQGGNIGSDIADADLALTSGLARTNSFTTHLPVSGGAQFGLLEVFCGSGSDTVIQRWTANYASGNNRTWQRRYAASSWTPWALIYNQSTILGPVTQASGVPTGALIEAGSNANGHYRRFACGLQECWRTDLTAANCSIADGPIYRSASVGWTFPAAFAAGTAPVVGGGADDIDAWISTAAPSDLAVSIRVKASVSKAPALNFRARATGRWIV